METHEQVSVTQRRSAKIREVNGVIGVYNMAAHPAQWELGRLLRVAKKEGDGEQWVDPSRRDGQHLLKDLGEDYWAYGDF